MLDFNFILEHWLDIIIVIASLSLFAFTVIVTRATSGHSGGGILEKRKEDIFHGTLVIESFENKYYKN
tara:strand:- start:210 stop:413 length:204 start_codon:yes stop_codon:yes gene_type:complete